MQTHFSCLLLLLLSLTLSAQEPVPDETSGKGVTPINQQPTTDNQQQTFAVVVGISDYQDEGIPDLRFAHKDAEAFAAYLQSNARGRIPRENIKLLTNEAATTAQIAAALEWLVEVSKENDQVIIYFSGHGDVETKTMFQLGYLLTWDSPARTYVAGAFPVSYLQAVVSTISVQNKAEVTLITDACRAGKLAGNAVGGAQITNANLSKQFANEIKILSCQPDEFSIEGEQWGGGRGVFSYHLIDALYGLADRNEDMLVNLLEIERYLEDKVMTEAAPHSQIPLTVGSKGTRIALVDEVALAQLKEQRAKEPPALAAIESKGFEEGILAGTDSIWQQKYRQFVAAVDAGHLLEAAHGQAVAYDLYLELKQVEELQRLHGTMQRNLAAALQDDAQQAINAYLAANPTELGKRYAGESDYGRYPRYLNKAAEILGEQNFYYPFIMAKLHYFKGLQLRLDTDKKVENTSYQEAIEKQLQALEFQEYSPFVLNELGVLHTRLKQSEKAVDYYEKAIDLAPEWGLPYINLCLEHFYNNDLEKADEIGDKAIELMPDYAQLYNLLGWVNANFWDYADKSTWTRKGVELQEDFSYNFDNTSTLHEKKGKFEKSIQLLQKAITLDTSYAAAHGNLGLILLQVDSLKRAEYLLRKAIRLAPTNDSYYHYLGISLNYQSRFEEAVSYHKKAIELVPEEAKYRLAWWNNSLGNTYKAWGKPEKAIAAYQQALAVNPDYGYAFSNLGYLYFDLVEFQKSEQYFLKYLNAWPDNLGTYSSLGYFYQGVNRVEDAQWMYLKALEINPGYLRALNGLVNLYQKQGDYEKALEWQTQLMEIAPNDPLPYISAGKIAYLNKQNKQAETFFRKAAELASDRYTPNTIGRFYLDHSEFDLAEEYLRIAISFDPDYHIAFGNLSRLYSRFNYPGKALAILDEGIARQITPREKGFLIYLKFGICAGSGQMEKAVEFANQSETVEPAYKGMGYFARKMKEKDYPAIEIIVKKLISNFPYGPGPYHYLSGIQLELGKTQEAQDALMKSIEKGIDYRTIMDSPYLEEYQQFEGYEEAMRRAFPEKYDDLDTFEFSEEKGIYYPEHCITLAKYYETQGEHERARFLYQTAIGLRNDHLSNNEKLALAEAYLKLGDYEKAKAICPDSIDSEHPSELLEAGKLFYLLNKQQAAQAHFERYLALSKSATPHNAVALFYKTHGEMELASPLFKLAISNNPEEMLLRRNLARLYYFSGEKEAAFKVLREAISLHPEDLSTQGVLCMLSYFDNPSRSKRLFEASEWLHLWEALELMRLNQFEQADDAWKAINESYNFWWLELAKYKYLQMKVRQGKMDESLDLFQEILNKGVFVNYHLYKTDTTLDPIRDTDGFKELMRLHFPEKANH